MVMEGPPAPHCVGREFVRQYYTLLNQAPAHLHRFYNNNSSFVHGGLDSPQRPETKVVVGQKQIHQKIQQLNFRDCHAKISQVDSQATLGDGVVVQVTGELSNSGQPMRRFTQTFVLAAQTPKKFYVHNDIFRYQDMLFADEESNEIGGYEGGRSETEEELMEAVQDHVIQASAPPHAYYNNTGSAVAGVVMGGGLVAPVQPAPLAAVVNGAAHPNEVNQIAQVISAPVVPQPVLLPPVAAPQHLPPAPQQLPLEEPKEEAVHEEEAQEEEPAEHRLEEKPAEPRQPPVHLVEPVSNEPKTYATLVKCGPISFALAAGGAAPPVVSCKPATEYSPPAGTRPDTRGEGMAPRGGPRPPRGGNVRGIGRADRDSNRLPQRQSFNESDRDNNRENNGNNGSGDGLDRDRRRGQGGGGGNTGGGSSQYTDSQQLFLGNLPHHATEADLKEVFRKFGTIIDLRIHSKPNSKGVVGNRVPNYGFVIFENPSSVQDVLNKLPIFFPDDGGNGQKLNIEEKKTRPRHSLDGTRMSDNRPTDNTSRSDNSRMGSGGGDNRPNNPSQMGGMPRGGGVRGGMNRGGGGPRGGFSRGGGMGGPMRGGGGGGTGGGTNSYNRR